MTAPARITLAGSFVCARCDGRMVVTRDAIGRERLRCPKCDGVAQVRRHPDEALVPQGLVRLVATLPPIAPGQLRCQRCARGVEASRRFCADCAPGKGSSINPRRYAPKPCARCEATFQPTGPRSQFCESCRSGPCSA